MDVRTTTGDVERSEGGLAPLKPFVTKSARVYEAIREAILDGHVEPGTRINLAQISKQLGTSETPVREALKRLESERLVRAEPHTGFIVAEISLAELIENLVLRREIEAMATQLAAAEMTEADIDELVKYVDRMERAATKGNSSAFVRINKEFHLALISRCPLDAVRRAAIELWEVGERTRALFVRQPRTEWSQEEHRQMIQAIQSGDLATLGDLVRRQKSASLEVALDLLGDDERERYAALLAALH